MQQSKTCFVAMPIRAGTEYTHFLSIYQQGIKPELESFEYKVIRGDELTKTGAITKDIMLHLANADLVVADLTDLNPNVFYELGVRHVLRGKGTILLLDIKRTVTPPFDLQTYRVIQYHGELTGLGHLRSQLESYLTEFEQHTGEWRDNPVHDWLPSLPINALDAASGTIEGKLQERLAEAERSIKHYERIYGKPAGDPQRSEDNPLDIVKAALTEANEGNLPADLMNRAEAAFNERNSKDYLGVVRFLIERGTRLPDLEWLKLSAYAENLGLGPVSGAIFAHALSVNPQSKELRQRQLSHFAHSTNPTDRAKARQELMKDIGITLEGNNTRVPTEVPSTAISLVGTLLDACHADNLDEQALSITESLIARFSEKTIVVRNHARALQKIGREKEALLYYQQALWCRDTNDTSALWYGNELHNRGRYTDAIEVYLKACMIDPNDAANFSHVADDIGLAIENQLKRNHAASDRLLPPAIDASIVEKALNAALGCPHINNQDLDRCRRSARRVDLDWENLRPASNLRDRITFAQELFELFRSPITDETLFRSESKVADAN